eukprot:6637676-Pyramimonas_sp.AAC.1
MHMNRRLRSFYNDSGGRSKGARSNIGKLTFDMLTQKIERPARLKSKAAECRKLLPLMGTLCSEFPQRLGPREHYLTAAVKDMNVIYNTMAPEPRRMSRKGLGILQQRMCHFLWAWRSYGGHMVYKHHAAYH